MSRHTSVRAVLALTTTLCIASCTAARAAPATPAAPQPAPDPQIRLSAAFEALQRSATESVNVTLGQWPLSMASWALQSSTDPQDKDLREALTHIDSIKVRSFRFAAAYDHSAIDSVRRQLSAPGWSPLVQIRNQGEEDVDIFVMHSHDTLNALTILASKPRELTLVNIVGSVDPAKLAALVHHFGGPELPM
jgi:hypothetical protein